MVTERAFVSSAISGMFISLLFAFIVLMCTTHNLLISLYSVFTIAGICGSVTAVMEL